MRRATPRPRLRLRRALGLSTAPALALTLALAAGCSGDDKGSASEASASGTTEPTTDATTDASTTGTTAPETSGTTEPTPAVGVELIQRLGGLWSGTATQTPLGTFPLMNMDMRAVGDRLLFSRADLDADNNLRFAFAVETHEGADVLVFRNGGYFLGILRDTRAGLVDHDEAKGVYHFCALSQGCSYLDALFTFEGPDQLIFDVKVKGAQHVYWDATRVEPSTLPDPFPIDDAAIGDGDEPFPEMPSLKVDVTWLMKTGMPASAWVILTREACDIQSLCYHSRSLVAPVKAGELGATVVFEQIHPGPYRMTAILDRNNNLAETGLPDTGDGISTPNQMITVAETGESAAAATIVLNL
ncbi:MAG: hypothetical protein R3B09_09720 [Nannocystaceae bacterium]